MQIHYKHEGIATFDTTPETVFRYMSAGDHRHVAFKSHRLVSISGNLVTLAVEAYNPDGSTFMATIIHTLNPPSGVETRMSGGPFDGARFVHTYTPAGGKTKVDLEGDFPAFAGISEAEELRMIDRFFTTIFAEDMATLRNWS